MAKTYKNVADMVSDLSEDDKFKNNLLQDMKNKTISRLLFTLRCSRNLTQKELATKIGCTQSSISKIESAHDSDVTVKNLTDYGNALNIQLEIGFRNKKVRVASLINYHTKKLTEHLDKLTELSGNDATMLRGAYEVFAGTLEGIKKSVSKFSTKTKESQTTIHVSPPLQEESTKDGKKLVRS
ncbi:MAG: helix-turn-helix domain-containing protein [Candidatus Anammoxibacter sp.]